MSSAIVTADDVEPPSLFSFATSELSQDAMICWLASWADRRYADAAPALHAVGRGYVERLFAVCGRRPYPTEWGTEAPSSFAHVHVERQVEHIDVLITVDDEFTILIEDKTGTSEHTDQLERYKSALVAARPYLKPENVFPVYLKLEEQSDLAGVRGACYGHFTRADILEVLAQYTGDNAILLDYREHARSLDRASASWKTARREEWSDRSWTGFFSELQRRIRPGEEIGERQGIGWGHIPNAQGGFMGFWWGFKEYYEPTRHQVYMQLEEGAMCIKVCVPDDEFRSKLRWQWHQQAVASASAAGFELVKPRRFGRGLHMTVAKLPGDYRVFRDNEFVFSKSIDRLLQIERAVVG